MFNVDYMGEQESVEYRLGQLTGQLTALCTSFNQLSVDFGKLSERLRNNEQSTTKLTIKMSVIGAASGLVGSAILSALVHVITK